LYGGPGPGPVGSGGVWHDVSLGASRRCADFWGKVLHGFALWGEAFQGLVLSCEALLGVAGFIGVLYCRVRAYFDVDEALHSIVMFCPVRHCIVSLGVFWQGGLLRCIVLRGSAVWCFVRFAGAFLRYGTVGSRFARLGAVGQAPAFTGMEV